MLAPWIETYTGKRFDFSNQDPETIDIQDIAHSLSHQCRYTGHSKFFYSVAEHSVAVADILLKKYKERNLALAGLLHDASEAYLSDIASPLKQLIPDYADLERGAQTAIAKKFVVDLDDPRIKEADIQMLSTEAFDLLPSRGNTWDWGHWGGRPEKVEPVLGLPPVLAKDLFLSWYYKLSLEPQILIAA